MRINYKKQFLKDLSKLPSPYRKRIETLVFETIPGESTHDVIQRLSKLSGHNNYYKVRLGEYRIGIYFENDFLEFKRVLHRKDIYRYFP